MKNLVKMIISNELNQQKIKLYIIIRIFFFLIFFSQPNQQIIIKMFKKKLTSSLNLTPADYLLFRACKTGDVQLTQQVHLFLFFIVY